MIDTSLLSTLTMDVMEAIAEQWGEDFHVRTAAIIVEVDSKTHGHFVVRCSDDRPWVLEAMLHEAEVSVADMRAAAAALAEREEDGE